MGIAKGLRVGLVLLAVGGGCLVSAQEPEPAATSRARPAAGEPAGGLSELVLIAPGTRVDKEVPPGWSHLVIKSIPRLASGDLNTLPGLANSTATLFRTVFLADIRPVGEGPERRFVLRRIGLGMCVPIRGHDTVVMSESLAAQGIDLGIVARTVLDKAGQEMRRGRLVARTPTFALFSAPAMMRVGKTHRELLMRYALLVDPANGSLRTLVWAIAPEPTRRTAARTMVLLSPGLIYDCGLDVLADRLFGALPVNWSFAIPGLPTGQPRTVPAELQAWSVRDIRTPREADQLEDALRLALDEAARNASR